MAKKKARDCLAYERKSWIDPGNRRLSLNKQLELLGLSKASYYYAPMPETALNLELMSLIDRIYTASPFYGSRRIVAELGVQGYSVNRKRVSRLMEKMGLRAIFPRRHLTKSIEGHMKYPYLLKEMQIDRPNQVWASDITYIRVGTGYLYLTAILDWFTRYVLSWRLSNTLDTRFCLEALEEAFEIGTPDIFNSDQGCQYTSRDFTRALEAREVKISMSGKGRCFDNILIERLWRSIKYEEVYIRRYETGKEAYNGLREYLKFYNEKRLHQSLDYRTPATAYYAMTG